MKVLPITSVFGIILSAAGCVLPATRSNAPMRCPKYIWQSLTSSGRGWIYNEYPSLHTRQRATALRAESEVDEALKTPYFFYDDKGTFRVYWYTESVNSNKELHFEFRWFEFDHDGKRTGESGGGGGSENVDPDYWLHKEGYP